MMFKVPYNPSRSMVLWKCEALKQTNKQTNIHTKQVMHVKGGGISDEESLIWITRKKIIWTAVEDKVISLQSNRVFSIELTMQTSYTPAIQRNLTSKRSLFFFMTRNRQRKCICILRTP